MLIVRQLSLRIRRLAQVCFWVGAAFVLPGLIVARAGDVPPARSLEKVRLQLKWQHQFQFAGYYAAVAQGYYRAAGLAVELIEAQPGHDPVEAVLTGQAEFGVGNSELVLRRAQGQPVVVLAAIFQHSPLVLLARRSAGVDDLHDLRDKPVMIEPLSAELFAYLKYEGIDPAKLHIQHHTFEVKDLIDGHVAAMSAYSTDEPFILRAAGLDYLTFTPRSGGIDFYGDNLFTTEKQIRKHSDRVRAFREASLKGWDYALAHPQEIVDLILRDYRRDKSRAHLLFEAEKTAQLMHPGVIETGHMNPGRWQHIADTYAEFGLLKQPFKLDGFMYEPNPRPDLRWLYWSLAGLSVVTVGALGWVLPLFRFNRRLRQSERQYREMVENVPLPVTITDAETQRILFANHRVADIINVSPEAVHGEQAVDFYDNPADREAMLAALRDGRRVTDHEVCLKARDGRRIWVLISAGLVEFDGRRGVVAAFTDITQRRAMQEELRRARDVAEAANLAKSRYLAVLGHEIRTPMNGILGFVGLLQTGPLTDDQRESVQTIDNAARSLLKVIDSILDYSKIEAGQLELELLPLPLADFAGDLCDFVRPSASARGLALRCSVAPGVPAVILSDPTRLRQILTNLLANAIKFTAGGTVELVIEAAPLAADGQTLSWYRIFFHVRDTGVGIPADQLARLFQPYMQADPSVARRFGGTGLGLSIAQRLSQMLGGGIRVVSQPSAGSTFTVEIVAESAGPEP